MKNKLHQKESANRHGSSHRQRFLSIMLSLLTMIFLQLGVQALAQWSNDPAVHTPICTASGGQTTPGVLSDGSGGVYIAWSDWRDGVGDIYIQRINADGVTLWATDGLKVGTTSTENYYPIKMISDGYGGAIIIWRSNQPGIFVQRVDPDGLIHTGWPTDGISITNITSINLDPLGVVSDGAGGAIVTWTNYLVDVRTGNIYAQRINGNGQILWQSNGILISSAPYYLRDVLIATDGNHGAIISWRNDLGSPLSAQHLNENGIIQWGPNGVEVTGGPLGAKGMGNMISDDNGGAIIFFTYNWTTTESDLYAQHIGVGGEMLWGESGVAVCIESKGQIFSKAISDTRGGAIVAWVDGRSGTSNNSDIYAQHINVSGNLMWPIKGVVITKAKLAQMYLDIVTDGSEGAIITWNDARTGLGSDQIYAQRIRNSGVVVWAANGILVSTHSPGPYRHSDADGSGGVIVAWIDGLHQLTGTADVYAQKINSAGGLAGNGVIRGTVFNDLNSDCTPNGGEELQHWWVRADPGGLFSETDESGQYFIGVTPGNYTVSEILKPYWTQTCPVSPGTYSVAVSAGQTFPDKDFGNQALVNFDDLTVSVAGGIARPGFNKVYGIVYENKGTTVVNDVEIELTLPQGVTFIESDPPPTFTSTDPNIVRWNIGSVSPTTVAFMTITVQISPSVPLGTVLSSAVDIRPVLGDVSPTDNHDEEEQTVQGSFDPNDKQVQPVGIGPFGDIRTSDMLSYLIRFQNTGTDTAFNIIVRDTLNNGLDITTFTSGASSHPYTVALQPTGEIAWTFSDILLPDSNVNEGESHGFVKFRVQPKLNLSAGTVIRNRASIYFDFNEPVITNTVSNRIGDTTRFRTFPPESLIVKISGKLVKPTKRGKGMPNVANLLADVVTVGGFAPGEPLSDAAGGMRVGISFMYEKSPDKWKPRPDSAAKYAWMRLTKWNFKKPQGTGFNELQKTLEDASGIHLGTPRGLDSSQNKGVAVKPLLGQYTKLQPKKHNNRIVASLIALKISIAASRLGITPVGLGELRYVSDNEMNGLTVTEIANRADSALTFWRSGSWNYQLLNQAISQINDAFKGPILPTDTISFVVNNILTLRGVRSVFDVSFLTPSGLPAGRTAIRSPGLFDPEEEELAAETISPYIFGLYQNYPNPFNPLTTIRFSLPVDAFVTLNIYNVLGQEIGTILNRESLESGSQEIEFDASKLASGVYFYRIVAEIIGDEKDGIPGERFVEVKKMLFLK